MEEMDLTPDLLMTHMLCRGSGRPCWIPEDTLRWLCVDMFKELH